MFDTCDAVEATLKHDRLAITTYRVCYEIEQECAVREWEFATKELAELARRLFARRYPTARLLTNTSFYSTRSSEERARYEDRLRWVERTQEEESRLLLLGQPA